MKAIAMKTTTSKASKLVLGAINCAMMVLASTPSIAEVSARKPIDPKGQFAKLAGQITQLPGEKATMYGNAFVVGKEGCHVLTNFHVAFGKRVEESGMIELIENVDVGHTVNFSFDLDAKSGKFKRTMKAKVVEFGNYEEGTSRGLLGDIALLRLESCLGKEYGQLEIDRPENGKLLPTGRLMTINVMKDEQGKNVMMSQDVCQSLAATVVTGTISTNCEAPGGASGSMILEEGKDGKFRLVGLTTRGGTLRTDEKFSQALYASTINKFLDPILGGEAPIAISPLADDRKPQSDTQQTAKAPTRTVVR